MSITRRRPLAGLILALLLLFGAAARPARAAPQVRYFPETGQGITGDFLQFWQATPDPLRILGYPISAPFVQESFSEPGTFYRVQYFERAVLEEHPQPDRSILVLGRLLGSDLAGGRQAEQPFQPVRTRTAATDTYDPLTQHTIADSPAPFKQFYERFGGLRVFGRPISEQFQEINRDTGVVHWVQYFERQRLEWHPIERDPAFRIMLGRLGDEYRLAHSNQVDPAAFVARSAADAVSPPFHYGINATLFYTDRARALDLVRGTGLEWVRQQIHWKDHQAVDGAIAWGELDAIVATAEAKQLNLLLTVTHAPDWATGLPRVTGLPDPEHIDDYAAFLGAMAQRYKGRVRAYQVWNEINLQPENTLQPVPDPLYYIDMLVQAYDAVKAADPRALVISTGLAPTEWRGDQSIAVSDLKYFRALFADERFWSHLDAVGVHAFGCANPPDTLWPERPGPGPGWNDSSEFYFRRVEAVRRAMVESGHGNRQIWITEFGWATANNTPGHEFGNQVSPEEQAEYLVQAFEMGRYEYAPWVAAMFVWNLNFAVAWQRAGNPGHQMAAYGIINADESPRPAYIAIQSMPKP